MFLYDFDTFGIIYTAAVAALIVLLIIPTVVFCVRKAPTGGATKAFRALDIVLLVLLVAAWAVYVLARLTVFGLHISASGGDAAFTLDGETLFALPGCATLTDVAASVLGTLLLGVLTFLCVLALVLSFARRHKEAAVVVVSSGSAEMPPVSVTAEEIVPAPAADGPVVRASVTEEAAESVAEEQVAEPQPEIAGPAPVRAKTEPTAPPRGSRGGTRRDGILGQGERDFGQKILLVAADAGRAQSPRASAAHEAAGRACRKGSASARRRGGASAARYAQARDHEQDERREHVQRVSQRETRTGKGKNIFAGNG